MGSAPKPFGDRLDRARLAIQTRFSLKSDHADDAEIDSRLRAGVVMEGTNLWVLMFAIFIASVGLNVNSTAVIIGAMLISPLMGPIMGVGYGVGIFDFALIRKALKNLGIATLIGLITSTAYFSLSPLRVVTSELLARTSPSIWDVLVALFGGLAGIIGVTRKQPSQVIPGVAIATALMPPLCTAGYEVATGTWRLALSALYLFTINCVFIAASSALLITVFGVKRKQFADARMEMRVRGYFSLVVVVTLLPSMYLAYHLVGEEVFRTRATQFVYQQLEFADTHVTDVKVNARHKRIEVSLIGTIVSQGALADIVSRLPQAGLGDAKLQVFQTTDQHIDVATLKASVLGDLYNKSQTALVDSATELERVKNERDELTANNERFKAIPAELQALYPTISNVFVAEGPEWDSGKGVRDRNSVVLIIRSRGPVGHRDRKRIEQWLRTRTKMDNVRVVIETG